MFSHGSSTIAPEENCPPPNPKTNPNSNWGGGAISLGAIVWIPFLTIAATILDLFSQREHSHITKSQKGKGFSLKCLYIIMGEREGEGAGLMT